MNHSQLLRNVINSYSDFPKVQADMRKIIKYVSSWQRMTLDPIVNNEPVKAVNPQVEALTAATEVFEASEAYTEEIRQDTLETLKAVTAQLIFNRAGTFDTVKAVLAEKYAGQSAVTEYLWQNVLILLATIEALSPAELAQLRKL